MIVKKISILLILSVLFLSSCSSDDSESISENEVKNYYPLVVENNWNFENTFSSPGLEDMLSYENLSISEMINANGLDAYELETDNPENSGPVTLALSQGILMKNNSSLIYTGTLGFSLDEFTALDLDLDLDLENLIIYDYSSVFGAELYTDTGSIEQSVEGIPIIINYTVSSEMGDSFDNFSVNSEVYEDVISSQLVANLQVETIPNPQLPFPITILQSQDAVVITNYFANNIGLIQSETDTNFEFEELPIPGFPLEDLDIYTLQLLVDFTVSLE